MSGPLANTAPPPFVAAACRVMFGASHARLEREAGGAALRLALPVLGGPGKNALLKQVERVSDSDGCIVCRAGDEIAGLAVAPAHLGLEAGTRELYRRMFA